MRQSAITQFQKCPYKYKLQYVDKLKTIFNNEANNALAIGTAIHYGAETESIKKMLDNYYSNFNVLTDEQINEGMKLEYLLPQVLDFIKQFEKVEHEIEFEVGSFHGTADLLVHSDDGTVDLYDYKYSNNIDDYMKSPQLHIYKYFLEQVGYKVNKMAFIFIPKTQIRQKKTEDLYQFRKRLVETLKDMKIQINYLEYDQNKVTNALITAVEMLETTEYPKSPTQLCDWCEYKKYCFEGVDYMILPKNERRVMSKVNKKVMWWYGAPFSGKTTLANKFPNPLMLNTDGNIKFVDSPFIAIKDKVEVEGRMTKRTLAWEVFKDAIAELEKKQNDFKTIIVDLLEDNYEHSRIYMYQKLDIEHESDNSFKAWDMVRTEFLSTLKRLMNLDYENIILISHEDMSKDVTKKTGDKVTRIAPNIQEKAANKIAGMVDIVARVIAEGNDRFMDFKPSEVIFGGGRLSVNSDRIPLEYEALMKVYDEVNSGKKETSKEEKPSKVKRESNTDLPKEAPKEEKTTRRRSKKEDKPKEQDTTPKEENKEPEDTPEQQEENTPSEETTPPVEDKPKRTRRTRRSE